MQTQTAAHVTAIETTAAQELEWNKAQITARKDAELLRVQQWASQQSRPERARARLRAAPASAPAVVRNGSARARGLAFSPGKLGHSGRKYGCWRGLYTCLSILRKDTT